MGLIRHNIFIKLSWGITFGTYKHYVSKIKYIEMSLFRSEFANKIGIWYYHNDNHALNNLLNN